MKESEIYKQPPVSLPTASTLHHRQFGGISAQDQVTGGFGAVSGYGKPSTQQRAQRAFVVVGFSLFFLSAPVSLLSSLWHLHAVASSRPAARGTEEACLKINTGGPAARQGLGPVAGDQDGLWET